MRRHLKVSYPIISLIADDHSDAERSCLCGFTIFTSEGQRLSFLASYSGGLPKDGLWFKEKGSCIHEWFRIKNNGVKEKLSTDDFLDLSLDDVGRCIELVYTPMRKDGMRGNPRSVLSEVIAPELRESTSLMIEEIFTEVLPPSMKQNASYPRSSRLRQKVESSKAKEKETEKRNQDLEAKFANMERKMDILLGIHACQFDSLARNAGIEFSSFDIENFNTSNKD